jgi:hypothetical protein
MAELDQQILAFPLSDRHAEHRLAQLDDVLAVTATMFGLAEDCDWEALTVLQGERDDLVREALSDVLPSAFAEAASEKIRRLLAQNDELLAVVAQAKLELAQRYHHQRNQTQAVQHYLSQSA